jgi:voltage-gated potassium channel
MSLLTDPERPAAPGWRQRWFDVIFGHQSAAGRAFDVALIALIVASVAVAMMDSVAVLNAAHGRLFHQLEWAFTLLFTVEYGVRLAVVARPTHYARSFFGVIDLLAVLPTWLSLLFPGAQYLLVIRVLRILRVFRILKLIRYIDESRILIGALKRSWRKILVFLMAMLGLVTVFGAVMYLVEGPDNGYTSIPMSMYWAIVTVATVGFGDIVPLTSFGKLIASVLILIGYGIIAVPTGIFTAEIATSLRIERDARNCGQCGLVGHEVDASHCRRCGSPIGTRGSAEPSTIT